MEETPEKLPLKIQPNTSSKSYNVHSGAKTTNNTPLIGADYFGKGISLDISKMFPVVIMATMSCGKSTLINALLGKDILPSRNAACTAKVYSILDNDDATTKIYLTDRNGVVSIFDENLASVLEAANTDADIKNITISSQIKGVLNTRKSLLIIDTPGTNNSRDKEHEKIAKRVLRKIKGGLIIYIINAEQMGINDDKASLSNLCTFLNRNKSVSVLFVVNKIDLIDTEKESLEKFIAEIKDYIINCGISNPEILPVSALSAHIFNKALNGEELTKKQYRLFEYSFELYKPDTMNLVSYAITRDFPNQYGYINLFGKKYQVSDIVGALNNTGIPYLKRYIQNAQICSDFPSKVKVNIKKESRK